MLKGWISAFSLVLLAAPAVSYADQMFPAGSILSCSVAEQRISSKTTAVGDPVLCTLDPVEKYGRSVLPYGSYLEGRFEDYKDPGHFLGKGWIYLRFDKMFVGNQVFPIDAKVVQVPKYRTDKDGRILGNGHAVKDTVEWLLPVLWPLDLINLPRRGPFPVIKPETRMSLELMSDLGIPDYQPNVPVEHQGLIERQQAYQQQQPAPIQQAYNPPQQYYPQQQPVQNVYYQNFAPPMQQQPQVIYQQAPPQQTTVVVQAPPRPRVYYMPPPPPYGYGYPVYRYPAPY